MLSHFRLVEKIGEDGVEGLSRHEHPDSRHTTAGEGTRAAVWRGTSDSPVWSGRLRSMPLENGTRLGPYEILAPLGAGGMGAVYEAEHTLLGKHVAEELPKLK